MTQKRAVLKFGDAISPSSWLQEINLRTCMGTSKCEYSPLLHSSKSYRLERLPCQGPETLHHRHINSADNRERKQHGWTLGDTSLLCPHQQMCLSSIPSYATQTSNMTRFVLRFRFVWPCIINVGEYLHSHSALSSCPDSTHPQPAHPG